LTAHFGLPFFMQFGGHANLQEIGLH
jgi:hypothetical protein